MTNSLQVCGSSDQFLQLLRGELSESAEFELQSHIETCEACRSTLDRVAADSMIWLEAGRLLTDWQGDQGGTPNGEIAATEREHYGEWQIQNVLDSLAPTDDPEMLGRLGGYEVSGVIGSGGMGVVLKAHDRTLDRVVAIKVLAPHLASSGSARRRFAREAKAAAAVLHPNVMAIHGVSNDGPLPYLVMPYVPGRSLQKRIDAEGPLPLQDILRIGSQIAAGLAAAHEQGLVHRDIKPANIMLESGVERVAITDFGLARAVDDATMTRSGVIAGTPLYMSPEQSRGEVIDMRSDLFSLGSVMYAMCTGHPPFRAQTSFGVLRRISDDAHRPVRQINPDIPNWLEGIIDRLLAKDPDQRFSTAEEVAETLGRWLAQSQQPDQSAPLPKQNQSPAPAAGGLRKWPANLKHLMGSAFGCLLIVAGILIVLELNKGTLKIESEADDVPIRIIQGEKVVKELTVTRSGTSIRIAAGQYLVEIDGEIDGITVEDGVVNLQRRGNDIVRIVKKNQAGATAHGKVELETIGNDILVLRGTKEDVERAQGAIKQNRSTSIEGIVTMDGLALPNASVEFIPESGRPMKTQTDEDGRYFLALADSDQEAAIQGKNTIRVSTLQHLSIDQNGNPLTGSPETVPAKYNVQSELEFTVEHGRNIMNLDLVSDGSIGLNDSRSPLNSENSTKTDLDTSTDPLIRIEPGESVYNERLKRFKFKLENIDVTEVETAQEFLVRIRRDESVNIIGAWGDPLTNSLVVIASPDAEQAIREELARWEAIYLGNRDRSLAVRREYLLREREEYLEMIAEIKLAIVDEEAAKEQRKVNELNKKLKYFSDNLQTVDRKLEIIDELVGHQGSNQEAAPETDTGNLGAKTIAP